MEYYIKKIFLFLVLIYFSALGFLNSIFDTKIRLGIIVIIIVFILIYFIKATLMGYKYKNGFYKIFILYIIYCIFLIFNGIYFENSERLAVGIYEYIFYSLPFFIPIFVFYKEFTFKYIEKIIKFLILINLITSILALYEYTTGNYIVQNSVAGFADITYNLVRAKVFDDSYLGLGALIAQLSILNLYYIFSKKYNFKYKLKFFCSFIINIAGIIATNSRGPLVAWAVAISGFILMYYIFVIIRENSTPKLSSIIFILLLLFGGVLCVNYFASYNNGQVNNYYLNSIFYRISSVFDWSNDPSNIARKNFWYYFIEIFKQNFLFGIGIGSTGGRILTTSIGPTESAILKRFVELGIFGATVFYLMVICVFAVVIKYLRQSMDNFNNTVMIITLLSSTFVIFIDGITYQVCESQQTMFFNWFICGLIVLICSKKEL